MKIKPEHYEHIKTEIKTLVDKADNRERMITYKLSLANDARVMNLAKRFRWDILYAVSGMSTWLSKEVYPYANDEHIDTALRAIIRELNLD